jgi:hypothetical protein
LRKAIISGKNNGLHDNRNLLGELIWLYNHAKLWAQQIYHIFFNYAIFQNNINI